MAGYCKPTSQGLKKDLSSASHREVVMGHFGGRCPAHPTSPGICRALWDTLLSRIITSMSPDL